MKKSIGVDTHLLSAPRCMKKGLFLDTTCGMGEKNNHFFHRFCHCHGFLSTFLYML